MKFYSHREGPTDCEASFVAREGSFVAHEGSFICSSKVNCNLQMVEIKKSKVNCNLQTVEIGGGSCTASMIAEDWLITAQHCVDNSGLNFADTNEHGDKVLISNTLHCVIITNVA